MKDTISVIIPAFNEQESLASGVKTVLGVLSAIVGEYEILIINDGSTDATGKIADRLAQKNKNIKVVHHHNNEGIGAAFRDGIAIATKSYITGFPGDNDVSIQTFRNLLVARRSDALVSSYMISMAEREPVRQIISKLFTAIMNFIFGLHLRYYNGYFICPLSQLHRIEIKSKGFTIFGEIKVKLIKQGVKYTEIPFEYKPRQYGVSKALTWKSLMQTISMFFVLIRDIYFTS